METFGDLKEAVQDDLTLGDESSFMSESVVERAINRAYIDKVSAIYPWPQTEDAKVTSSIANKEYYDYPDKWRPLSIWKLVVDGDDYDDPMAFRDYEYEKGNNYPSGTRKIWSNKGLRYFITQDGAAPTTNGNDNIEIHGHKIPDKLTDDNDMTLFSLNMPELNEAIVLEAKAILKSKGEEDQVGQFASAEAKGICARAWKLLAGEMGKYERSLPQFNVPNYFAMRGGRTDPSKIGNF